LKRNQRKEIRVCPKCFSLKYFPTTLIMKKGKITATNLPRGTMAARNMEFWDGSHCGICGYIGRNEDVPAEREFIRILKGDENGNGT